MIKKMMKLKKEIMLHLENKRLIFIGGKGGVGKSCSASAVSLYLSERIEQKGQNGKILLFSTDPAHSLGDSFNMKIGNVPTPITKTLQAVEINTDQLMNDFKGKHKDAIQTLLTKAANLDKKDADQALELTIPGIDEFMSLVKLSSFIDNNEYKTIVVDTAPTGHTLRLLSAHSDVNSWLIFFSGLHSKYKNMMRLLIGKSTDNIDYFIRSLSDSIYRTYTLITDKEKTEFVIVTIPDLMAIEETKRLFISLYSSGIRVNNMIINNVQTNTDCAFCLSRKNYQTKYINMINAMYPDINKVYIPLFPSDVNSMTYLKTFKDTLFS